MNWKPAEDIDRDIRGWMRTKGWAIGGAEYDHERKIYSWEHKAAGRPTIILRISRQVLESYPGFAVLEFLDRLNVATTIRARPEARYVMVQSGSRVTMEEAPG